MTTCTIPTANGHSYRCGDLAAYFGISPRDVLDTTADIATNWWHHDEPDMWMNYRDVLRWLDTPQYLVNAADVEIVLKVEWEVISEACGVEVRS